MTDSIRGGLGEKQGGHEDTDGSEGWLDCQNYRGGRTMYGVISGSEKRGKILRRRTPRPISQGVKSRFGGRP